MSRTFPAPHSGHPAAAPSVLVVVTALPSWTAGRAEQERILYNSGMAEPGREALRIDRAWTTRKPSGRGDENFRPSQYFDLTSFNTGGLSGLSGLSGLLELSGLLGLLRSGR